MTGEEAEEDQDVFGLHIPPAQVQVTSSAPSAPPANKINISGHPSVIVLPDGRRVVEGADQAGFPVFLPVQDFPPQNLNPSPAGTAFISPNPLPLTTSSPPMASTPGRLSGAGGGTPGQSEARQSSTGANSGFAPHQQGSGGGFTLDNFAETLSRHLGTAMARLTDQQDGPPKKRKKLGVDDLDQEEDLLVVKMENLQVEDNGVDIISWPARSLATYTGPQKELWANSPRVTRPLRESYDVSFLRGDTAVNPLVTLRDHDRGAPRTIKQYSKANIRVSKSRAVLSSAGLETHDIGLVRDFTECSGMYQLISALWQYSTNLFMIRRDDHSGLLILQVLHYVKFFLPILLTRIPDKTRRDTKQLEIVTYFVNEVFERNSLLGRHGRPPMGWAEMLALAKNSGGLGTDNSPAGEVDWLGADSPGGLDPYTGGAGVKVAEATGRRKKAAGSPGGVHSAGQGRGGRGGRGGGGGSSRGGGSGGSGAGGPGGAGAGGSGKDLCRDWNKNDCRPGRNCIYTHKCSKV